MLLSILLLALQEPAPAPLPPSQDPTPEAPLGQDPVSIEMLQAKLGQVTDSFAEADRLLNRTVEDLAGSVAPTATEPEEASLLSQATATSLRLVGEMEELLELLPQPPPDQGGSSGGNSQSQPGQEPQDGSNPEEKDLDDGNKPGGQPHGSTPQDGLGQAQSLLDSPLRDYLRDPRDGQWGKLPPRLQQAIDNASDEQVPLRYRRWLVEYHRQDVRPAND
ncbi:MAG: hypothetical protein ACPG31_09840 [Planctomycetota bacterium]